MLTEVQSDSPLIYHCRRIHFTEISLKIKISRYSFDYSYDGKFGIIEGCTAKYTNPDRTENKNDIVKSNFDTPETLSQKTTLQHNLDQLELDFRIYAYANKYCGNCCEFKTVIADKSFDGKKYFDFRNRLIGTDRFLGMQPGDLEAALAGLRTELNNALAPFSTGIYDPIDFFGAAIDSLSIKGFSPSLVSTNRMKDAGGNYGDQLLAKLNCDNLSDLCKTDCSTSKDSPSRSYDDTYKDPRETEYRNSSTIPWDTVKFYNSESFKSGDDLNSI